MRDYVRSKLRLVLSIVSQRRKFDDLTVRDFELLGYDTYKFGAYGKPDRDEVLSQCEGFLFDCITATWEYDES